jgi:hypothetical protein
LQFLAGLSGHIIPAQYHYIQAIQFILVVAEAFTNGSFDAIACHRRPGYLAGNCQAKAWMIKCVRCCQHRHPAIVNPVLAIIKDPLVFRGPGKSYPSGKTRRTGTQGNVSDRQTGTALGATGVDDATTVFGAHAGTETVCPLTLQVTGLIGSFHGSFYSDPVAPAHCCQARKGAKVTVLCNELSTPRTLNGLARGVDNFFRRV